MSYAIVTDTSANLPTPMLKELDITVLPFSYLYDGQEHTCMDTEAFDGKAYYNMMRDGVKVTTSQITPFRYTEHFRPLLEAGQDILFVGMSSGISGSYAMAEVAAEGLREEFPLRKLRLVDSLGASLGEGIIALKAAEYREKGFSIDENADLLLAMRHRMAQIFTVDDLMHLRSTGRLSNAAAFVGTVLQIKPLLKGNEEGKIVTCGVARGFKKAVAAMAKKYNELVVNADEQIVGIAHADCREANSKRGTKTAPRLFSLSFRFKQLRGFKVRFADNGPSWRSAPLPPFAGEAPRGGSHSSHMFCRNLLNS